MPNAMKRQFADGETRHEHLHRWRIGDEHVGLDGHSRRLGLDAIYN